MIWKGIDVKAGHKLGWTALMATVINWHKDIVELLLQNGANQFLSDIYNNPKRAAQEHHLRPIEGETKMIYLSIL